MSVHDRDRSQQEGARTAAMPALEDESPPGHSAVLSEAAGQLQDAEILAGRTTAKTAVRPGRVPPLKRREEHNTAARSTVAMPALPETRDESRPLDVGAAPHTAAEFDMRTVLEVDGAALMPTDATRRPSASIARAPAAQLTETAIDGFKPVRARDVSTKTSKRRRETVLRVVPLVLVTAVVCAAITAAAVHVTSGPGLPSAADETPRSARVALSEGTFVVGLSRDNKETVLTLCRRISSRLDTECRTTYLEGRGEFPPREVQFAAFEVDRYEVSNGDWTACEADGGCPVRDINRCQFHTHRGYQLNTDVPAVMLEPDRPAVCVTRDEAALYCSAAGGALPTADQWERAARGDDDDRMAPWGVAWAPNLVNWAETDLGGFPVVGRIDGYELSAPVDEFEDGQSPDGVYNMLGNVSEWMGPDENRPDGIRGGSYRDTLDNFRVTHHTEMRPTARRSDIGFRCVY